MSEVTDAHLDVLAHALAAVETGDAAAAAEILRRWLTEPATAGGCRI